MKPENLRTMLREQIDPATTHLHTDTSANYERLASEFASHTTVNHRVREWVRHDASTNQAESYFAQLKRSLDGTHHHVSRVHLHRYLAEFDFRYTTCNYTDTDRMVRIVSQTQGRRLTYAKPTAR